MIKKKSENLDKKNAQLKAEADRLKKMRVIIDKIKSLIIKMKIYE